MDWLTIFEKCIWFGSAALGFAILFNVPPRTLMMIWLLAALGGFVKITMINLQAGPIIASFLGASLIGSLSIPAAHNKHAPPLVFSIPAVIPMIPGIFAYRMMLGFITLTDNIGASYNQVLSETVNNGVKCLFILIALAVGVALPNLVTRKESAKEIKIIMKGKHGEKIG